MYDTIVPWQWAALAYNMLPPLFTPPRCPSRGRLLFASEEDGFRSVALHPGDAASQGWNKGCVSLPSDTLQMAS